jgi:peptide/nickel transport system ATP-binding protein
MLMNLQTERGLTMLFITHDIGLARKVGDRLGVMLAGRLVEVGPAAQVLTQPLHPYTRLLLDSVNVFAAGAAPRAENGDGPLGCPFAGRCPRQEEICRRLAPQPEMLGQRRVACHFPLSQPLSREGLCPKFVAL